MGSSHGELPLPVGVSAARGASNRIRADAFRQGRGLLAASAAHCRARVLRPHRPAWRAALRIAEAGEIRPPPRLHDLLSFTPSGGIRRGTSSSFPVAGFLSNDESESLRRRDLP